jgi:hypothetical protein
LRAGLSAPYHALSPEARALSASAMYHIEFGTGFHLAIIKNETNSTLDKYEPLNALTDLFFHIFEDVYLPQVFLPVYYCILFNF